MSTNHKYFNIPSLMSAYQTYMNHHIFELTILKEQLQYYHSTSNIYIPSV